MIQYPLQEKIGDPDLLIGREKEFGKFGKWLDNIPRRLSKSRVILARRKSGKTSFVQRIFNQLWSENGAVIPFYFDIAESKVWYPDFAIKYYQAFASQYISFLERDETLVSQPLSLEEIKEYGLAKSHKLLARDVDSIHHNKAEQLYGSVWETACAAPHRFAAVLDIRFLVILDEFQNITQYVYPDSHFETKPIDTLAGSFHSLSESKIAPMLVTSSYVGWLLNIISQYLEAGRLSQIRMSPYLTPEEGLQAVYKYAEVYGETITNQSAIQINELCMADPFFISCVIESEYEGRDLTNETGVVNTVNYEISDRNSEMSKTWNEYIQLTLQRVNDRHAKSMLLHLSKHPDRYWSTKELKKVLNIDLELNEIQRKLLVLVESDMIEQGVSDIQFRGLQDGTLNLVLRNRFEEEINNFVPDLKQEFQQQIGALQADKRRLQGMLNYVSGKLAEHLLANEFRSRKRFALSDFFEGVKNGQLNIIEVRERIAFQREDGKQMEIDVKAESNDGRVVLVEVRKRAAKTGLKAVEDFVEKAAVYNRQFPDKPILPAFLSLNGFTDEAQQFCKRQGIGTAEEIRYGFME